MSTDRALSTPEEVRVRRERMNRNAEKLRAILAEKKATIARWRAEGLLPPEEPQRPF
jgi:hypothetical protein